MEVSLLRLPTFCARLGFKRPTIYKKIAAGLLPPPVKVGVASVWPSNETDALVAAQIRGISPAEQRALVSQMVADRPHAGLPQE